MAPSDEELERLAKAAYEAWNISGVPWESPIIRENAFRRGKWEAIALAVRAALEPPVTPLAPGEMVTIKDGINPSEGIGICSMMTMPYLYLYALVDDPTEPIALDAAGVAQLIASARRWQAAQGEAARQEQDDA